MRDTLIGLKIVDVRALTPEELETEGWGRDQYCTAIVLSDGSILFSSRDDEGNGPGRIFGMSGDMHFAVGVP